VTEGDVRAADEAARGAPFRPGDEALLVDARGRRALVRLEPGRSYHTHAGPLAHDDVLGRSEGTTVRTALGKLFVAWRPTLADRVLEMPRGAQVIYPKDLGAILVKADIRPGVRVVEAGVGSGALSMVLVALGAEVVAYEVRREFAERAVRNVRAALGEISRYRVQLADIYEGIRERALDRVLLDVPEPWRVLEHARRALRPGGILLSYLPTANQVAELRRALDDMGGFGLVETSELLERTWHVAPRSVRPDHRMVAHTGFLTVARRLADDELHPSRIAQAGHGDAEGTG
jgi:tRNA (adenine57-N1/adenine58-N1)-methyltransferase